MIQDMEEKLVNDLLNIPYGEWDYLGDIWALLYQTKEYKEIITQVHSIPLKKGVCAKPFNEEDVGWFCQKCQKDSNCVICQFCFENSNHSGHPIYLKRFIAGCCDCGDHEAWDPKGFCTFHQGFIDEAQASIELLPPIARQTAPIIIKRLSLRLFFLIQTY